MTRVLDWRNMDRATLDRAYNNAAAVQDSDAVLAEWETRSAHLRGMFKETLELAYGPKPRNRIDFLVAAPGAPTLAFFHGGYWQMRAKESFAFIAEGPLARGLNVALIGYTLAPEATIDDMVTEARRAIDWLQANLDRLGGKPGSLWLSGWSAGAHLAAMVLDHPAVRGCVGISGIYDMEPIRHCYVNDKLGLDAETARRNSPLLQVRTPPVPLSLYVGQDELPLLRQQTQDFAAACARQGWQGPIAEVPNKNHFSVLDELSSPGGRILQHLLQQVGRNQ